MKKRERFSFFQKNKDLSEKEWPRAESEPEWPRGEPIEKPMFVPPPPKKLCELCQQRSSGFRKFDCNHLFCGSCANHHETMFNQCPTCRYVLNNDIHHMFASEMPVIPSYDEFEYQEGLNE
jgi:hypothetical protein